MQVHELISILQKHHPTADVVTLNGSGIGYWAVRDVDYGRGGSVVLFNDEVWIDSADINELIRPK